MYTKLSTWLCLFVALTGLSAPAVQAEPDIDYLALGVKLLRDGYTERAAKALAQVQIDAPYFKADQYYSAKGILLQRQGYPKLSNIYFAASLERGLENPTVHLYMARNYWQRKNYPDVLSALDKAGEHAHTETMLAVKAEAHKQLGQLAEAWVVLDQAIALFPEATRFYRQKFNYLIEAGFYLRAMDYAETYLKAAGYSADDYLALGYALRENGQLSLSAQLLEEGWMKHPTQRKLVELLAQVYMDQQAYFAAALVLDWASLRMPDLAYQAAALYMKSGSAVRALQLNRRVSEQDKKFRQRLGIDIALGDFEALTAKQQELERYGLLDDDSIKYALAYGYFIIRDYSQARTWLKLIRDDSVYMKAVQLLKQIEECSREPVNCL